MVSDGALHVWRVVPPVEQGSARTVVLVAVAGCARMCVWTGLRRMKIAHMPSPRTHFKHGILDFYNPLGVESILHRSHIAFGACSSRYLQHVREVVEGYTRRHVARVSTRSRPHVTRFGGLMSAVVHTERYSTKPSLKVKGPPKAMLVWKPLMIEVTESVT